VSSNTTSELNYRWGGTHKLVSLQVRNRIRDSQTQQPANSKLICLVAKWMYFTKYGEIFKLHNYSQALECGGLPSLWYSRTRGKDVNPRKKMWV